MIEHIVAALITEGNQFLVVQEEKDSYFKLPEGGIKEGETEIQALKRELLEELTARCEIIGKLLSYDLTSKNRMFKFHIYRVNLLDEPKQNPSASEQNERNLRIFYVGKEQLKSADAAPSFKQIVDYLERT